MRVVVRAGFDRFTSMGQDGIDLTVRLAKAGVDVLPWPTTLLPGLPREFTRLLEKDPAGAKDVVLAVGPASPTWEYATLAPVSVGWSWEVGGRPPGGPLLKHLLVPCPRDAEAAAMYGAPVSVLPIGFDDEQWPYRRRDALRGPMKFLMLGDSETVRAAWTAARRRAGDRFDATLTCIDQPLGQNETVRLFHDHEVLVVPDLTAAADGTAVRFMATGGTVIAPDWGRHQNWLHPDVAYALPCDGGVDEEDLVLALLAAHDSRAEVARRGERAATWIRETHGWDVIVDRLVRTLERL